LHVCRKFTNDTISWQSSPSRLGLGRKGWAGIADNGPTVQTDGRKVVPRLLNNRKEE